MRVSGDRIILGRRRQLSVSGDSVMRLRYLPGDTRAGESFTRPSPASYYDVNATVQTAAINVKRDAHYREGVRTLLLESQRTNLFIRASELENVAWTARGSIGVAANTTLAPDGTLTADTLTDSGGGDGSVFQSRAVGTNDVVTVSAFIKKDATGFPGVQIQLTGGGTPIEYFIGVRPSDGATWVSFNAAAVGATNLVASIGDQWRVKITVPNNGTGNTAARADYYPGIYSVFGGAYAAAAIGITKNWGAQMEIGAFTTSFIPTAAAAVTRGVDAYTIPGVSAPGSPRLFMRYWDLATSAWVDFEDVYVSNADIVFPVDREYAGLSVFGRAFSTAVYRSRMGI